MRVAIDVSAVPARPAGAGVYVEQVVGALAAGGQVELDLVATTGDAERWRRRAPRAQVHAVVPPRRPLRLAWEQARAPALARRLGSHVWHGPHYTLPLRTAVATVVTVHDLTFFDHPEWHERSKVIYFRPMIRAAVSRADVVVCVSRRSAERLEELLAPRAPVVVVPHGVDHDRFRPEGQGDLERLAALGVRPPFVAFVGTVEPRKNVPALVRAFARVAPDHPELSLVLAGRTGWAGAESDTAATAAGLEGKVTRLGYVPSDAVPALLRSALAVAYAPLNEGFGLPAIEALACGSVLVTTTGSPMADFAGEAALLVPPADEDALAEALATAVTGGPGMDRLRVAGPEVAAPFTWARSAQGHVAAYRLAGRRSEPGRA